MYLKTYFLPLKYGNDGKKQLEINQFLSKTVVTVTGFPLTSCDNHKIFLSCTYVKIFLFKIAVPYLTIIKKMYTIFVHGKLSNNRNYVALHQKEMSLAHAKISHDDQKITCHIQCY